MSITIHTSSSSSSSSRVNVLREVVGRVSTSYKRDLDASASQTIESASEAGVVLDFIASERLRCMPQSGGRYDKVLRYAELFIMHIAAFSQNVAKAMTNVQEATQQIYGSIHLLLQVSLIKTPQTRMLTALQLGETHVTLLEKLLGVYYRLGAGLEVFSGHGELLLNSTEAQSSCSTAFAALLQVTANSSLYYYKQSSGATTKLRSGEFERHFGALIEKYYYARGESCAHMWSASISQSQSTLYSAEDIRRFLAPQDSVTQALMEGRLSSRHRPAEFTCEWATKRVSDIARGKNGLTILTGKEYCGKSVLANWIAERMTNNRGRIRHDVLMFEVDSALKENSSDIAIAKALVLQVFDKLIGNQALYRDVCGAIKAELAGKPQEQVVDLLWLSIHNSISSLEKTMIIVDGTDGLETKQQTRLLQRLSELSASHPLVKAIAVSRPLGSAPPKGSTIWSIETQDIHHDIVSFAYERLSENSMLGSLQPSQLQSLAERLATASNGSFAWADIAIEVVSHEQTISAVSKSIDGLPKDLKGLIDRLITTVSLQDRDSRAILAWMLAAQRPLLLGEVKALLEVDCSSVQITERFSDIENDVRRSCGGLISITDGLLRFKTLAIRHHLVSLAGSVKDFSNSSKNVFPFNMQEASYDLCIRSLAYVKLTLDRQYPYSQEPLTYSQLTEVFGELPFMEYACRYWLSHFRSSPMHQHPGTHKLTSTFKAVMPDSVPHTRLEYTCLRSQYSIQETCDLLQLSLSLRTLVFTEQAPSVLQTLINVALTVEKVKPDEANQYYHRCFKVGRELLDDESTLIIWIAHRYIDTLKTMTKSTELEEILTYIIRIYKRDYGTSHDSTLVYMRRLAEYYVITKETTKAFNVYKEIYEVMVSKYGYHATETTTIFTSLQKICTKEATPKYHSGAACLC